MTTQTTQLASTPEKAVYGALKKIGIDFIFQSSQLGGRNTRGGAIVDFLIPSLSLAINIQSFFWHYGNPDRIAQDRMQQLALEGQGITVIYIDEEDALRNVTYYVEEALQFRDHSRMTRS